VSGVFLANLDLGPVLEAVRRNGAAVVAQALGDRFRTRLECGEVKCAGINSCGGKGECAAVDGSHECAGKNSCKGKGWRHTDSAAECTGQGGTVLEG
jgi:hypothetical protein